MPKKSPVWHLGWDWGREGSTHKGSGGAQQGHIHTAGLGHAPAKSRGLHLSTWVSKSFLPEDIWQGCNRDGHLHLARKGSGGKAGKQTACCGGQHLNKQLAHHWSLTPAGLTLQHPLQGARMPHLQGQMVTGRSHARAKLHTSKITHEQNCARAKLCSTKTVHNQRHAERKSHQSKNSVPGATPSQADPAPTVLLPCPRSFMACVAARLEPSWRCGRARSSVGLSTAGTEMFSRNFKYLEFN